MPIGDLDVPVIGKNVVIAILVQSHILIATFILGASLIAPTAEYLGMVTKQPRYERFARNLAKLIVLLFATLNLGELVAYPARGQHVAGVFGLGLYLLAYVPNLHVRCTRVPREVGAPHGCHDLTPAVDPPGVGGEEREDVELRGCELH
jgi:hypothetical protein